MDYNPFDLSYRPHEIKKPSKPSEEKKFEKHTIWLVSTTHRIGVCREPITSEQREYLESQGEEILAENMSYNQAWVYSKNVWITSRCRETDEDFYTLYTFHTSPPTRTICDQYKIYKTIFDIPLRPVKIEPAPKQIWSRMCV